MHTNLTYSKKAPAKVQKINTRNFPHSAGQVWHNCYTLLYCQLCKKKKTEIATKETTNII
jgi:hypothetical protein